VGQEKPRRVIVKHTFLSAFCSQFTENMNGELYRKFLTEIIFSDASKLLEKIMNFPTR